MVPSNQATTRHRKGYKTIGWLNNDGSESNHREHLAQPVRCSPDSSWNLPDPSERAPNSVFHPPFSPPDWGKNTRPNSGSVPMLNCDSMNRPNSYLEKLKLLRPPSPKPIQEAASLDLRVPCSSMHSRPRASVPCSSVPVCSSMHSIPCSSVPVCSSMHSIPCSSLPVCSSMHSIPCSSMHSIPCSSIPSSSLPYPSNTTKQQPERDSEGLSQASSTSIFSWEPRFRRMFALPSLAVPASGTEEGGDGEREGWEEEEGWCQVTSTKMGRRCAVCGDSANGNFFGATVCLPCKSFFIRCTREGGMDIHKQCDGRCDVKRDLRHRCQYCRFQRCLQIGMKRKEKPEVVVAGEGQTLCRVCGDLANGIHFGVFTCEGCKKFFRRSLQDHRSYVCRGDGGCSLNPRNRNHCRRCRYLKCKAVGMSRDAIRMGRPRKCRSSRPNWQKIAFYNRGPAPSMQDSNPCHPSLQPSQPSPLGDSATKHPLSVTRDVQVCRRRGAGNRFLTKHGCLPRCLPYHRRWSCPQKLGNRNNGFHELKIRSHKSVAGKPVPLSSPMRENASSSDRSERQSFPMSSSPPENSLQAVNSPSIYDHVHSTSLDRMARVAQHVLSTGVGTPLIRNAACVSTNSSVLSQSRSQQSLRPSVSSKRGPFSSLNPNSRPEDKPGHELVTNAGGFLASQDGSCIRKHGHTAGVEHNMCRLSFPCHGQTSDNSPQNLVLNTRPHSSSSSEPPVSLELTGSKIQNSTVECLQSRERVPSPWRTVGNVPEYSSEGLDLCLRKPSQGQSSFTKQASTEVQHERDIIQEREIIPPRFADSRIQSLNSINAEPFSGASVSVPNMNTEDSFCDRQPLDLSCSGRLRQSPSELSLRQEREHTLQGSPRRAVEPVQRPTMRKNALINHQHCQDLHDRPCGERSVQLSEPAPMENLDNASLNPRRSSTGLLAEQDRGSREPEVRPQQACSCTLSRPPGQVKQPANPPTACHVTHNEQSPSCPAPVVDKSANDRVIRTLLDMNGQDLDKITDVVSGLITLLELIRDRKELSRRLLSNPAKQ